MNSDDFGDYFVIEVDRSKLIIPGRLTWQVDYTRTGTMAMQMMSAGFLMGDNAVAGDITGEGKVDFYDIQALAGQWLKPPGVPSADINGDNFVDFKDFALLAENWMEGI